MMVFKGGTRAPWHLAPCLLLVMLSCLAGPAMALVRGVAMPVVACPFGSGTVVGQEAMSAPTACPVVMVGTSTNARWVAAACCELHLLLVFKAGCDLGA